MFVAYDTPEVRRIIDASGVRGKRADVSVAELTGNVPMNSYWDSGSRDEFAIVDLGTLKAWRVPTSHPFYDRRPNGERMGNVELRELPPNTCLVQGGISLGEPARYRVLFRSENLVKLLPKPDKPGLSDSATSALNIIWGIKGGYRQSEFDRAGLGNYSAENPHVAELVNAGYVKVNKNGAMRVTTDGRNARQ